MAWWTHRTKTGRVVYERKKNTFLPCDVFRILKQLEPVTLISESGQPIGFVDRVVKQYLCLLAAQVMLWRQISETGARNALTLTQLANFDFEPILAEKLAEIGVSSVPELIGELVGNLLEQVKEWVDLSGQ